SANRTGWIELRGRDHGQRCARGQARAAQVPDVRARWLIAGQHEQPSGLRVHDHRMMAGLSAQTVRQHRMSKLLTVVVVLCAVAMASAGVAGATVTNTFTGSVSSSGTKFKSHTFSVP